MATSCLRVTESRGALEQQLPCPLVRAHEAARERCALHTCTIFGILLSRASLSARRRRWTLQHLFGSVGGVALTSVGDASSGFEARSMKYARLASSWLMTGCRFGEYVTSAWNSGPTKNWIKPTCGTASRARYSHGASRDEAESRLGPAEIRLGCISAVRGSAQTAGSKVAPFSLAL